VEFADRPIGFFDSGVGGISVLKKAVNVLPQEDFIYLGDSKNAPYGEKSLEEVKELTCKTTKILIDKGIKALVIACNTATSAAIEDLRIAYPNMIIIGMEPALKPAVQLKRAGKILVMATPTTLSERKFSDLMSKFRDKAEIESVPCPGLAELVESGKVKGEEVHIYLKERLAQYSVDKISSIVLGCTHYPFVIGELKKVIADFGHSSRIVDTEVAVTAEDNTDDIFIIDGNFGTSMQLKRKLIEDGILKKEGIGKVEILNSLGEKYIKLSKRLLSR
jgi:glutamate racemase